MSSVSEAAVKSFDSFVAISGAAAECADAVDHAHDERFEDAWWVCRVGRKIEVHVECFLIKCCGYPAGDYGNFEVHHDNFSSSFRKDPAEAVVVVQTVPETCPLHNVRDRVGRLREPDANNVVNIALVEKYLLVEFRDYLEFTDSKVDGGVGWGWWGSHCSSCLLVPCSVAKGEVVVLHHELEGVNGCVNGDKLNGLFWVLCSHLLPTALLLVTV